MSDQARTSRVLIALIVSMTIGAVILMALDNGALKGGAFSLSVFNNLPAIENVVLDSINDKPRTQWNGVEVFYSNTASGNIKELTLLKSISRENNLDAHFVICNGKGGEQGEVQPTNQWKMQYPALKGDVIRICVIFKAEDYNSMPNECQITRIDDLISFFQNKFNIADQNIIRPVTSQL